MSFLLASMKKDLLRWKNDMWSILLWLCIPLLVGGLLTLMFDGGGGVKPHGTLLIADMDNTVVSGLVVSAYSRAELGELITVENTSLEKGTLKINDGAASGLLIIPEGFSEAFLNNEPVVLELKTNPSETILPAIITDVTEILLDSGFYIRQLFGEEIDQFMNAGQNASSTDELVASIAISLQDKVATVAPLLAPPAIDIVIVDPPPTQPEIPMAMLFLPGVILMALMFTANGLASDYWVEREHGTLRRLVFTPGNLMAFLGGKALAAGLMVTLIGGLTLFLGFIYHDLPWDLLPSTMCWIIVSGMALFAWFGALKMLAGSRRAANLVSTLLLFPLLMVGGSFFPLSALPDFLANIGRWTPNGFIADQLTRELIDSTTWSISAQSWVILLMMLTSGLAICAWRLQTGFARN